MVKKLEPGLTAEVTLQPSPRLWLACCSPHPAHSTPREGATGGGGETYELEDMEQSPQSTRQNVLPVKRINRSLLMRHEYLTRSLVELMQVRKTSSGTDGVLHHPPEAFDGVEVMSAVGG